MTLITKNPYVSLLRVTKCKDHVIDSFRITTYIFETSKLYSIIFIVRVERKLEK